MFRNIGLPELLVVLVILLLLFGAKKLPDLSRSLGEAIKEFKNVFSHEDKPGTKSPDDKAR